MSTSATLPPVDYPESWVLTEDRIWHLSFSNLPLSSWSPGRTLCGVDAELSRCDRPPSRRSGAVCSECVEEHRRG